MILIRRARESQSFTLHVHSQRSKKGPPDPNPPTFTPRFSSQALATGGPEHLHTKIFLPSLGHWRPRAQKEKTFTINFAIRHRTSQKTWPKPAQTPSKGSTFSRKNPPKGSPLSPPAERECGWSIANNVWILHSQFFACFFSGTSSSTTDDTPRTPKRTRDSTKFDKIHQIYEPFGLKLPRLVQPSWSKNPPKAPSSSQKYPISAEYRKDLPPHHPL